MLDPNAQKNPQKGMMANLILDIALPVLILNKLSPYLGPNGPVWALILAISLPLGHGLFDLWKSRKINWISLLGLLNVGLTGGFALMKLEGFWFAVKEASFPALIGVFVFFSGFSRRPLFSFFLEQPALFHTDKIKESLAARNLESAYSGLIKEFTFYFSGTFFISAVLNFGLAIRVFTDIPLHLEETKRSEILNGQIADMTWMGYIVIALPLVVITTSLFFFCLKKLSKLTDLSLNDLLRSS